MIETTFEVWCFFDSSGWDFLAYCPTERDARDEANCALQCGNSRVAIVEIPMETR